MTARPSLSDLSKLVVADASVLINLNASGHAERIIRACPGALVVTEAVADELQTCPRTGRRDDKLIDALVAQGQLRVEKLGSAGLEHFGSLVIGSAADTLDDGEAATIAYALEMNAVALIDERKARRICGQRFPTLSLMTTVQMLRQPEIAIGLGATNFREAIVNALSKARMQVAPADRAWVIETIGSESAAQFPILAKALR